MTGYLQQKDIDVLLEALDCYISNEHLAMINTLLLKAMLSRTEEERQQLQIELRNYKKDRDKEEIVIMLKAKLLLLKQQIIEKGENDGFQNSSNRLAK